MKFSSLYHHTKFERNKSFNVRMQANDKFGWLDVGCECVLGGGGGGGVVDEPT